MILKIYGTSRWLHLLGGAVSWVVFASSVPAQNDPGGVGIDPNYHHLGDSEVNDWDGVDAKPEGTALEFTFPARASSSPVTLRIQHRDVEGVWNISVNGIEIEGLKQRVGEGEFYYEIPANVLVDGNNRFTLVADDPGDDIAVGRIRLVDGSLRDVLGLQSVSLHVRDSKTGEPLPARVSIESAAGDRPAVYHATPEGAAVREGLLYVKGDLKFEIPRGSYRMAVTRGTEWSRAVKAFELGPVPVELTLELSREVDTPGFIAADTHIHTFTFSGHGDASTEERMISLAGEGVELAIATDHNHSTDYRPYQLKLELDDYFTPVVGNEVSTDNGHFNGFPLDPAGAVTDHRETNWVKIVDDLRSKGAKVVILNHPRWPYEENGPFGVLGLNRGSGDRDTEMDFTFDAMELVNSTTDAKDPLHVFHDWFALLNRGEKIAAVGVSDSHTVRDPVGQGRTYIKSSTDDPAKLNVDELCNNIVAGHSTVSLGIYAELIVDQQFGPGDLVKVKDNQINVDLRVRAPAWIHPKRAIVFVNGVAGAEQDVPVVTGEATNAKLLFQIPASGIDAHVVCVVLGDGVKDPGWKTFNDYTLAATNPVYLDVNGDGHYSSPRESAQRVRASIGGDRNALINTLEIIDPVVGVQLISLVDSELTLEERKTIRSLLEFRSPQSDVFRRYLEHFAADGK